ncbi:hypothetical protein [Streptococcus uberis]|uniref:hypothetical protein n=1 Tax=Streptococcus uberis TaxID=1349 RepID=UPI00062048A5|nr:hypothetical protein [Streptococcus uberis]KKF47157.1 hypothetical protein AF62_08310 [Streptococcus uberis C8329]KKF59237.1 hypothetical protein AF58_00650 [Streptococcus uberis C6344]QBX22045.1 hypothetical protein Javan629_0043 [Streptococcus phage Javan629]
MKIQSTFIVIRSKKHGAFLTSYENKPNTLAYTSDWSNDIEDAITVPIENYEFEKANLKNMAKMLHAEVVKVEASYNLTYPNGSDVKEIKNEKIDNPLRELFESFKAAKEREGY